MNENKLMQQFTAIFSVFMVLFYLGVGIFFIFFSNKSTIDEPVRVIIGATFILYGIFRAIRAYAKLMEVFSNRYKDNEADTERKNRIR